MIFIQCYHLVSIFHIANACPPFAVPIHKILKPVCVLSKLTVIQLNLKSKLLITVSKLTAC